MSYYPRSTINRHQSLGSVSSRPKQLIRPKSECKLSKQVKFVSLVVWGFLSYKKKGSKGANHSPLAHKRSLAVSDPVCSMNCFSALNILFTSFLSWYISWNRKGTISVVENGQIDESQKPTCFIYFQLQRLTEFQSSGFCYVEIYSLMSSCKSLFAFFVIIISLLMKPFRQSLVCSGSWLTAVFIVR